MVVLWSIMDFYLALDYRVTVLQLSIGFIIPRQPRRLNVCASEQDIEGGHLKPTS